MRHHLSDTTVQSRLVTTSFGLSATSTSSRWREIGQRKSTPAISCAHLHSSLERIQQYLEIDQEPRPVPSGVPPASWPTSGELVVEKLSARYSSVRLDVMTTVISGLTVHACRTVPQSFTTSLSRSRRENGLASVGQLAPTILKGTKGIL